MRRCPHWVDYCSSIHAFSAGWLSASEMLQKNVVSESRPLPLAKSRVSGPSRGLRPNEDHASAACVRPRLWCHSVLLLLSRPSEESVQPD
jgi:hypothetical protein